MNLRNCAKFAKRWNLIAVFESLFDLNILANFDEASEIYKIVFDEAKAAEIIQIQIEPQPKILVKQISKISDAALFFILYFSKINGVVKIAMDPANDEYSIYEHVSLQPQISSTTRLNSKIFKIFELGLWNLLQKSFKMIPNSNQFPGTSNVHFLSSLFSLY